jgi:hypothetical protein
MAKINKWNWSAFLSCPIWSIYHGFYMGTFSIYIPVLMEFLLIVAKSNFPIFSQISFAILLVTYVLYFSVSTLLINIATTFGIEVDRISGSLFPVLFYVCCNICVGIISNKWLYKNKSAQELFLINKNGKKWILFGLLIFIPATLAFDYSIAAILNEITGLIGI